MEEVQVGFLELGRGSLFYLRPTPFVRRLDDMAGQTLRRLESEQRFIYRNLYLDLLYLALVDWSCRLIYSSSYALLEQVLWHKYKFKYLF
jgi:hypothetical protein